jgi:hypothetical protein
MNCGLSNNLYADDAYVKKFFSRSNLAKPVTLARAKGSKNATGQGYNDHGAIPFSGRNPLADE